jgi:putative ABC transport system permease protein
MISFLLKGLLRDRHRSLFPALTVTIGVMLTVLLHCWVTGIMGDVIDFSANFSTGHVKIMTRSYLENADQTPNDLALVDVAALLDTLRRDFPDMTWVKRIRFGGLIDVPDEHGETRDQGPAMGLGIDLLSDQSSELARLNIEKSLVRGHLPGKPGDILISDAFAYKLNLKPGEKVTLLSSTMNGSLAMQNFTVAGTVQFGVRAMDQGAIIVDISDVQRALDMEDATGEILGYFRDEVYDDGYAEDVARRFNAAHGRTGDDFAPVMVRLRDQNDLGSMMDYVSQMIGLFITLFVLAMSIVLWNVGLIGGLRRYGEVGVRLAIGENKGRLYRSMIYEAVLIGILGSITGTALGLGFAYILQTKGIDMSAMMKSSMMMFPTVVRANITPEAYYIGFLPGLFSTVLGTALSGIGIYRRKTAQLFKELEV